MHGLLAAPRSVHPLRTLPGIQTVPFVQSTGESRTLRLELFITSRGTRLVAAMCRKTNSAELQLLPTGGALP